MRVIGTAGHVDHGKSTLVQALTGTHPDRLREEQERQMTIDLGFAWFTLDNGEEVGIVDVPGHRDFIENMLAGVGGIDAALFVIAADEGIMPQTREHLAILNLLEVTDGVIALTKQDLVDEEWRDLVIEDIRSLIEVTGLSNAPIISVSAKTGEGIEELKHAIAAILEKRSKRLDMGRPRLPIDRVFTLTGFGTVVTGTLIGGRFEEGQEVQIQPSGMKARIRSLQTHKQKRDFADPGGRLAMNLSGIDKSDIERGETVVLPGQWASTRILDCHFHLLGDLEKPLKHNQEVKFFHGTAQRMARARTIGQSQFKPGDSGWIQILLEDDLVADRGDHFILRRPSPGQTLGGGKIIDPTPQKHYRMKDTSPIARLEALLLGDPEDIVREAIRRDGPILMKDLEAKIDISSDKLTEAIQSLLENGKVVSLMSEQDPSQPYYISSEAWENLRFKSDSLLAEYHTQHPLRVGMPLEEYRKRLNIDPKWSNALIETSIGDGWLARLENIAALPTFHPKPLEKDQISIQSLMDAFNAKPFNTPSRKEILELVGEEVLQYLLREEVLISLSDDVLLSKETYSSAVQKIEEIMNEAGTITVAEVRDTFSTSRKYALALMEYLDAIGITVRDGDVRRLVR